MPQNIGEEQQSTYKVNIPVYEGPLDLLLHLIERAELDITAVSLALVTDQFLAHINAMGVPAEEISSFLVVAAKLVQIKSEALLPRPPLREPGEEDPGEELARQLLIYKQYKEIANWLENREIENLRTYLRVAPPPRVESRLDMTGVTLADLRQAYLDAVAGEADKASLGTVIAPPRITIREKITMIAEYLKRNAMVDFNMLVGEKPTRMELVVTFLALLELVKRYQVMARQEALFGDIQIEKVGDWQVGEDLDLEFE